MMHRAPLWVNFFAIAVLAATCATSPMATTLSPPLPKIDFIGPPDAVAPLVLAITVLRRINTTLAAGGEPPLTELRRAERLLESASFDPRTYEPNAESPSNAHGIIVTGISLGRFLDQRGYRLGKRRFPTGNQRCIDSVQDGNRQNERRDRIRRADEINLRKRRRQCCRHR